MKSRQNLMNMKKIAVVLANMGGPDTIESVKPYLYNLFSDPAIISIPMPEKLRLFLARRLANWRYIKSKHIYKQIGGKSPLYEITNNQCRLLNNMLNSSQTPCRFFVFSAMRYWHPKIEDIWYKVVSQGFDKIMVFPLYPFYSTTTTESITKLIDNLNRNSKINNTDLIIINRFGNHPLFIEAVINQINSTLKSHPNIKDILFSAHSIPLKCISDGDPYLIEITSAFEQLRKNFSDNLSLHLSFQSKLGPMKWIEPSTRDKICEIADRGVKGLIVYPFGFVADNSETIYELDIEIKNMARERGIDTFIRINALNDDPLFIKTLNTLILNKLGAAATIAKNKGRSFPVL